MQLAGRLPAHSLPLPIPAWMGVWFAVLPTIEGFASQALAAVLVLGSFLWVRSRVPKSDSGESVTAGCEVNA